MRDQPVIILAECILITYLWHIVRKCIMQLSQFLRECNTFSRVHQINLVVCIIRAPACSQLCIICDNRLTLTTALGSDNNDTIGCTSTIKGSSCCILQNINSLDVLRINTSDSITNTVDVIWIIEHIRSQAYRVCKNNTIQDPKRFTVTNQSTGSTNTNLCSGVDFTTTCCCYQVWNLAFKQFGDITDTTAFQLIHIFRSDG